MQYFNNNGGVALFFNNNCAVGVDNGLDSNLLGVSFSKAAARAETKRKNHKIWTATH